MVTTRPPKTIAKPTALGTVANTDTKLLIYGLFQKVRVLAQDGEVSDLLRAVQQRHLHSGTTTKELDREALRNVEVERKVLREYRVSKSMPVPEFLHERFDKADSDSASV